jgi:outer membrane protein assembly factor BamB
MRPGTSSPLVYNGKAYTLNSAGVLSIADEKTGKNQTRQRLEGKFTSTPIAADGLLYFFSEAGKGTILDTRKKGEVVAKTDLKETILCTPAISGGALYVRSDGHLWKFAR